MPVVKLTEGELRELIREVASGAPTIDLKNPEFWYQDVVNPLVEKLAPWLQKNIYKKKGRIKFSQDWPYPVSPEAIEEYDDGSTFFTVDFKIVPQNLGPNHVGWNLDGGALDEGNWNGMEYALYIDPDIEITDDMISDILTDLHDTLAHETHHLTQFGALERMNCPIYLNVSADTFYGYFRQCDEKPAFIMGFRARAAKTGQTIEQSMRDYLENYVSTENITRQEAEEVLRDWLDYQF
jgi:hypothetical protein